MATRKLSEKEIANEKSRRIMEGVAAWTSFYRSNPHRFVKDYLNVDLKLFQKILLYAMMHMYYIMYLAARGQGAINNIILMLYKACLTSNGFE